MICSFLNFPLITFQGNVLHVARSFEDIMVTYQSAVQKGFYKNMQIIDCEGNLYRVNNARKLKGYGLLWGYNLFFNQRIQIELDIQEPVEKISAAATKEKIVKYLKNPFSQSAVGHPEIVHSFQKLETMDEMFAFMVQYYYNEK